MKISTLMVVVAVALAFAVSGCKYDKSRSGAKGGSGLAGANGSDISTTIDDSGDIDGVGVGERPFEEYCTRCTDVDFAPVYFGFDSTVAGRSRRLSIPSSASTAQWCARASPRG